MFQVDILPGRVHIRVICLPKTPGNGSNCSRALSISSSSAPSSLDPSTGKGSRAPSRKLRKKNYSSNMALFIPRFSAWKNAAGSPRNGAFLPITARRASIPSPQPAANNWSKKPTNGSDCQAPSRAFWVRSQRKANAMFGRKRNLDDFTSEIEAHIQLEIERLRKQGMSEDEARSAARC